MKSNLVPTADRKELRASELTAPDDLIRLEFVSAYSRVNHCYAEWLRRDRSKQPRQKVARAAKLSSLKKLKQALRMRDELEDKYAPYGIIAEPIVCQGFVVDIRFSFGRERSACNRPGSDVLCSAYISIPLPSNLSELGLRKA